MTQQLVGTTWNTSIVYPEMDSPELKADLENAESRVAAFNQRYSGKVAALPEAELLEALKEIERIQELLTKPGCYSYLLFSCATDDETIKAFSQRIDEKLNELGRELLFFELELMQIPDDRYDAMAVKEDFSPYRRFMDTARRFKQYSLDERAERLLKQKSLTGAEAFSRLFDEVTGTMMFRFELDGEEREMTGEEIMGLVHHPDAGVRERSMTTFLQKHEEQAIVLASVFNNIALDHGQDTQIRGYSHPMQPTNLGNDIPDEVVDRLMAVSESNYGLARDYFRLKKKLLGLPVLKNTDLYAPLTETTRHYTLEESRELVVSSFTQYDQRYGEIVDRFFSERRMDLLPRPGKTGGAYCMGITPSVPPFILANHTGNLRDVSTLAHELGHGLHFVLAQRQNPLNYHPPIPLAEVASVFGELLLTRRLLHDETDRKVKISLLAAKIEDAIATTLRQNVLTRFEQRMHLERKEGLVSATRLCEIWWEENGKLYGDAVEMIPAYRWGWSYISHFIHTRFYCYGYIFAQLLAFALYRKYEEDPAGFHQPFDAILGSGGSLSPADTAALAGLDLTDEHFWQKGYDILQEFVDELKALLEE